MANPYETYKQQSIMTMTSGQMLITVYNELIKQLNLAQQAFSKNNITDINRFLQKAQFIIVELKSTLNFEYDISNNLNDLYDYFNGVLLNANLKKDSSELAEIIDMATELKDTFTEADRLSRT